MWTIFLLLLASHVLVEFLIPGEIRCGQKPSRKQFLWHPVIHGVLSLGIIWDWRMLIPASLIAIFHGLIDWLDTKYERSPMRFVWDQFLHISLLILVSWGISEWGSIRQLWALKYWTYIMSVAGFVLCVQGVGIIVGEVAFKIMKDNPDLEKDLSKGLKNGGKQIGQLERALIFILMLVGQPAGIGFLVAAKSILRFEEAKRQNISEYVLIGTFWSFSLAIAITWLTLKLARI